MFNTHFEDLFATRLPYSFRQSLVVAGRGSSDSGSGPGGSQGPGDSDSDGGSESGGSDGGGGDTSGGMSPDAREGSKESGYGPGGSSPTGGEGLGSNSAIDAALEAAFGEIDTAARDNPASALGDLGQRAKDIAMRVVAKAIDGLALSNPLSALATIGTKLATGQTIGEMAVEAARNALASGATDEAAATAASTAAASALSDASSESDGGGSNDMNQLKTALDTVAKDPADAVAPATPTPAAGSWDDYVSQFFGTPEGMQSAKDMLQGQADFIKQQVDDWKINRGQPLNDYTAEVEKQGGLLDDLIDQSREGTGLFSPVNFTLAGQQIAFVPKAQRAQAEQMANFGQVNVSNASSLYNAQASAADDTLKNSIATSPQSGGLAYLDQLRDVAKTGETLDLARDSLVQTGEDADARIDAMQPGILDYIKGIGTLFA